MSVAKKILRRQAALGGSNLFSGWAAEMLRIIGKDWEEVSSDHKTEKTLS